MPKFIKYPSIEQFRHITKQIQDKSCFIGLDQDGNPIFDYLKPKPILTFTASEKIHGTNAAVCYSKPTDLYAQSRERIISVENDNAGFAKFVVEKYTTLKSIIIDLSKEHNIDLDTNIISLYGEWAGGSIQKNSALTGYDKAFILFQYFKVTAIDSDESAWYLTTVFEAEDAKIWIESNTNQILNIMNFPIYQFTIDFNDPARYINDIIKVVEETIEPNSPTGSALGLPNNIGEGLVCSYLSPTNELFQFKVKGEKHSNSPIKPTNPVDLELLNAIDQCVEKITHNWRFEQALTEVFGSDYKTNLSRAKLGDYLKWIATDTLKEESDIIAEHNLEPKDVMGKVQNKAKQYFFQVESNEL